jgi:hypothetical protein
MNWPLRPRVPAGSDHQVDVPFCLAELRPQSAFIRALRLRESDQQPVSVLLQRALLRSRAHDGVAVIGICLSAVAIVHRAARRCMAQSQSYEEQSQREEGFHGKKHTLVNTAHRHSQK